MLRTFAMVFKVFSGVFASVSDSCFKCFICFQTYVASVASGVLHVLQCNPPAVAAGRRVKGQARRRRRMGSSGGTNAV
jgi:hypothetical protein